MHASMRRSVLSRLGDDGWTPGRRDIGPLLDLVDDQEHGDPSIRALCRAGLPAALAALDRTTPGRIFLIGRVAKEHPDDRLLRALAAAIAHDDPRVRKAAIISAGKVRSPILEEALVGRYAVASDIDRRAMVVSLGKIGGSRALELVRAIDSGADPSLARIVTRARLLLERTVSRTKSEILLDVPLPEPHVIVWRCRRGLEQMVAEDMHAKARGGEAAGKERLTLRAALATRLALDVCIEIARQGRPAADVITSEQAIAAMRAWTRGPVRFRIELVGGRRRSEVWDLAENIARRTNAITNDPTGAAWDVIVSDERLLFRPKAFEDPRFRYRVRDVPAASHPTIAAALARVAGAKRDDFVWDPFVGSGLELIERARLGPYRRMVGTDVSNDALGAARENLRAAGVEAELAIADARTHTVRGVTLVITNPPMGRRLVRDRSLKGLYDRLIANVAYNLARGGRMVWLSPRSDDTAKHAASLGLAVRRGPRVDMGGFDAEIQVFEKRG